jgi:hypothetical protein
VDLRRLVVVDGTRGIANVEVEDVGLASYSTRSNSVSAIVTLIASFVGRMQ